MSAQVKIKVTRNLKELGQFANLPSTFKAAPREATNKNLILQKLSELSRFGIKQLQEAGLTISQLNRYNMKADKRVELAQAILAAVYPAMSRYYQNYQTKVLSLPESNDRREAITACVEIAEQTSIAFKHVFRELYSTKNLGNKRNRDRLIEVSVRILELLRVEQRLRGLRHQKLSSSAWQDINRVFFSMLLHDDTDEEASLLGGIGTQYRLAPTGHSAPIRTTARKLYVSIQLFGLLDAASWSTRLFHAPDSYLEFVENAIEFRADPGEDLMPGWLMTNYDQKTPAVFQREQHLLEPRICMEYTNLYNRLVFDYEELAKMKFIGKIDEKKVPRPLTSLEPMERFPFLETMLFGLRPRERKAKRHAAFGDEGLKIYYGFADTYRLLGDLASEDVRRVMDTRSFADSLASQSSRFTDTSSGLRGAKWEIVNFSSGGLLVNTKETNDTNPIQIGQIVSFIPGDDVKRPIVGYVSRINRPSDHNVEIAIVRLANHSESAIIKQEKAKKGEQDQGVIIFQTLDGRWGLIAKHEYDYVSGSPLKMLRENNQLMPARIGNVLLTKQEFVVFEFSAPGL